MTRDMLDFIEARDASGIELSPDDFVPDASFSASLTRAFDEPLADPRLIDGVTARLLGSNADARGHLIELFSLRGTNEAPRVHVYQVFAEPGSIRAWIFHRRQTDLLAFTDGDFQVALYDIRADSPTHGRLNILRVGAARPTALGLPPYVVHGVCNLGRRSASYLNMPDSIWRREAPDKNRLRYPDPRLPFTFG